MKRLIAALNYQVKRDNFTYYAFIAGFAFVGLGLMCADGALNLTGAEYTVQCGFTAPMVLGVAGMMLAVRICGWDMSDKTINYEIAAGHSRRDVYLARVIVSLMWCFFAGAVLLGVPVLLSAVFSGWGDNMDGGLAFIRYLLIVFPLFRMVCCIIMLTFVTKNALGAGIAAYLLMGAESIADTYFEMMTDHELTVELAVSNITELLTFNSYMGYINGEDVTVYDAALSPSFVILTVVVSVAAGGLYLYLGYLSFKRADMK